ERDGVRRLVAVNVLHKEIVVANVGNLIAVRRELRVVAALHLRIAHVGALARAEVVEPEFAVSIKKQVLRVWRPDVVGLAVTTAMVAVLLANFGVEQGGDFGSVNEGGELAVRNLNLHHRAIGEVGCAPAIGRPAYAAGGITGRVATAPDFLHRPRMRGVLGVGGGEGEENGEAGERGET